MRQHLPEGFRNRRMWILLACGYALFATCGGLAFFITPSPSLASQGGATIVSVWASFCAFGGLTALVGLLVPIALLELTGVILLSSASLTWTVSLLLQGIAQGSTTPMTAACIAGALSCILAHRALIIVKIRHR